MNKVATTAREFVRHVLFTTGAYSVLTWLRAKRGITSTHLQGTDAKSRFQAIYDTGVWRNGNDATPGSGLGSSLLATSTLRQILPSLLNELGGQTLLDVGCGDFTWMQHVIMSQQYIGVDIVPTTVSKNKKNFENSSRKFYELNAIVDVLPDADLILCREVLFHLSFEDIKDLIENILSKERSYIIATSDRSTNFNSNIQTGDFRLLNLEAWPIKFPAPIRVIDDSAVSPERIIGVWDVRDLKIIKR